MDDDFDVDSDDDFDFHFDFDDRFDFDDDFAFDGDVDFRSIGFAASYVMTRRESHSQAPTNLRLGGVYFPELGKR